MDRVEYEITIGAELVSNDPQASSLSLTSLTAELDLAGTGARAVIELAPSGSFSAAIDDPVVVSFSSSLGSASVFTGYAAKIETGASKITVRCRDDFLKLSGLHVEGGFEETDAGTIVQDILGNAGAAIGEVDPGPVFSSYVLHRQPGALRHLQDLAHISGVFLYTTGDGLVNFKAPVPGTASKMFFIGQDILDFNIQEAPSGPGTIKVFGEGAARGADKAHWLSTDLSGVAGEAAVSTGNSSTVVVTSGALRSGDSAAMAAEGFKMMYEDRPYFGHITVPGSPGIEPGDLVAVSESPQGHNLNIPTMEYSSLRVRKVIHRLGRNYGFITKLEF